MSIKYRVQTDRAVTVAFDKLEDAEARFEYWKDYKMGDGVTEDSFVEIVKAEDDFEDYTVIKRVFAVIDEERTLKSPPSEAGYTEWTYWAKWQEEDLTEPLIVVSAPYNRLKEVTKQHEVASLHRRDIWWLIDQAERMNKIANRWVEIESNGTKEQADNFYDFVQDVLSENPYEERG